MQETRFSFLISPLSTLSPISPISSLTASLATLVMVDEGGDIKLMMKFDERRRGACVPGIACWVHGGVKRGEGRRWLLPSWQRTQPTTEPGPRARSNDGRQIYQFITNCLFRLQRNEKTDLNGVCS